MTTLNQVLQNPNMTVEELTNTLNERFQGDYDRLKAIADYVKTETETQFLTIMEMTDGKLVEKTYEMTSREMILMFADKAMEGNLLLVGTNNAFCFVGNPPAWFAYPEGVSDVEFLYVLNRMESWVMLLQAYLLTEDEKYALKVKQELLDWIEQNPRPALTTNNFSGGEGVAAPWRSLEAGIRMFKTWPSVLQYLAGTGLLTADIVEPYTISVYEHLEVLYEISPQYYPNADHNHYIMESLGLYAASVNLPELKDSQTVKEFAKLQLERCASIQITDAGGHLEGCPHYHNETMYYFYFAEMTAKRDGDQMSADYQALLDKAVSYTFHTLRPNGRNVPWGDSDASDSFPVRMGVYAYEAYNDPTCLEGIKSLTGETAVKKLALEYIWDMTDLTGFMDYLGKPAEAAISLPTSSFQKDEGTRDLKQICFRTDWTTQAYSVFFACRVPIYDTHQHIDPMGFDFMALGKPLIVDPGRFTYNGNEQEVTPVNGEKISGNFRKIFKQASSHNTLTVDNKDPFTYKDSWTYSYPSEEAYIGWINDLCDGQVLAADAEQHNFLPVIHKRLIAFVDNLYLLIVDKVEHLETDSKVQIYYNRDTERENLKITNGEITDSSDDVRVAFGATGNLESELTDGYVSDAMDVLRESVIVKYQDTETSENRYFGTVIVPYQATEAAPVISDVEVQSNGTVTYQKAGEDVEGEEIRISFSVNNESYQFSWITGKELTRI
ncbi:hypothetical protein DS742_07320 [Lacrimispora amygdalina]|uniref:Uncharacterized protein n=1 Tax=Lacrimispora amygdalina TaxID=253257 RepID=A0A3E2NF01_9FIRM|nr:heparinase II/III family protein [Clostridium indicum]RFZ79576.1 hypothetical protein DS742_07320 [Clostridium indicum]